MTTFTVPYRGTDLELSLSLEDMHRIAQEAVRAADLGMGFLVQARGPDGTVVLPEGVSAELVRLVREHLGVRQAG